MFQFLAHLLQQFILSLEGNTSLFPGGMILHLYTNNQTPTQSSALGDFTALTNVEVPGYVPGAPTWLGTPYRNQDASWVDYQTVVDFVATGAPPSPQTVYGWYLTDSAGATLVAAGLLAVPFTFTETGDGFGLQGEMKVNQETSSDYGVTLNYLQQ